MTAWAGVIGSPISHSLSPVIHRAAWGQLGIDGWEYRRCEVDEATLPAFVAVPVWASLTGNVIVPGSSLLTKVSLACPTLAALGMATGCASMGVLWARVRALKTLEANEEATHNEGPAED